MALDVALARRAYASEKAAGASSEMATGSAAKVTFLPVILAAARRALSTLPSRSALAASAALAQRLA